MSGPSSSRRTRITSPQTRIALSRHHRPAQHLLPLPDENPADPVSGEEVRAVFIRQRRLAARTLCVLGGLLFGLSGLIGVLPALDQLSLAGVPASWLLLMAASYPLLLVIAVLHVRAAERIEEAATAQSRGRPAP